MIMIVDWPTFHTKYLNKDSVFVKEYEEYWEFYTCDKIYKIKCVLEKSEDQEQNLIIIERYLSGRTNIVKVLDIAESYETVEEDITEAISDDAIREEDLNDLGQ